MNIFVLDRNPKIAAQYHNNKHVIKMILESAQMICTIHHLTNSTANNLYKPTHKNHPCTIWARKSLSNYRWLKDLIHHLNDEYRFRYKKNVNHKSFDLVQTLPEPNIQDIGLTDFALAMPDSMKLSDPVESYRNYYRQSKADIANWGIREKPFWWDIN
jgi:hypothetical protein